MPTTLIFGGNGRTAKYITRILVKETSPAHQVYSIIRNSARMDELEALGAKPIVQSIEEASVSDMVMTLEQVSPDVVIWAAGAGSFTETNDSCFFAIDRDGAIKAMDACSAAGVKRFINISAMDVRDHTQPVPDWYDEVTIANAAKVYNHCTAFMDAKLAADKALVTGNKERKLDYTIVRPAGLGVQPGTGKVFAGKVQLAKVVKREDLARVVVQCIQVSGTIGLVFDVSNGDNNIVEEVARVVEERVDVFDGFY